MWARARSSRSVRTHAREQAPAPTCATRRHRLTIADGPGPPQELKDVLEDDAPKFVEALWRLLVQQGA